MTQAALQSVRFADWWDRDGGSVPSGGFEVARLAFEAGYEAGHTAGSVERLEAVEESLAKAIEAADAKNTYACLNQGTAAQVATAAEVATLKAAFAYATGTAVSGAYFEARIRAGLERARQKTGKEGASQRQEFIPGWTGAELHGALERLKASPEEWIRSVAIGLHAAVVRSSQAQVAKQVAAFSDLLEPARKAWLEQGGVAEGRMPVVDLRAARTKAAQAEYESYEFDAEVEDSGGWELDDAEIYRTVYVRPECEPGASENTPSQRLVFVVRFESGSAEVADAYARDSKGNQWGWRSGSMHDQAVKAFARNRS